LGSSTLNLATIKKYKKNCVIKKAEDEDKEGKWVTKKRAE
jgi:hypothetical protein